MNRYKHLLPLAIIAVMACGCSRVEDKGETTQINNTTVAIVETESESVYVETDMEWIDETTTVASDNQTVEFSTIYGTDESEQSEDEETTPEAVTQSDTEESIPSETQTEPQSEEETLPEATAEETTADNGAGFEANATTAKDDGDVTTASDETTASETYSDVQESETTEAVTTVAATTEAETTQVETTTEPETTTVPETTKSGVILLPEVPI
ncbi:MAG: hypothetical protein K6F92_04415 [Lachnospiraceae bacterium]|nr:hypothetical protein [Lachnospiraceae bacterium]